MALNKSDSEFSPDGEDTNSNAVSSKLIAELGEDTQHSAVVDGIREHISQTGSAYMLMDLTFENVKSNSPLLKGKSATAYLDRFGGKDAIAKGSRIAVNLGIDKDGYPSIGAGGKRLNKLLPKK